MPNECQLRSKVALITLCSGANKGPWRFSCVGVNGCCTTSLSSVRQMCFLQEAKMFFILMVSPRCPLRMQGWSFTESHAVKIRGSSPLLLPSCGVHSTAGLGPGWHSWHMSYGGRGHFCDLLWWQFFWMALCLSYFRR
jgi:hypothetical protein